MKSIIFVIIFIISNSFAQDIFVEVNQGVLRGSIKNDRKGGSFYSFQKIPYAVPPLGGLRFKDPLPVFRWDGILDATEDLPECFQVLYNFTTFGQEDCLYLNVYTPELPNTEKLKPVMVFIHGGSFFEGSGRQDYYSPEFLIPADVLVVTINYRLNIFGFYNIQNSTMGTPGNAGLKDQNLALKWVQENIRSFGGDPNQVTLMGQSAGAISVHLHMLSPLSEGLFSKVILMSGLATAPYLVGVPDIGYRLAELWGIPTENEELMLTTLQSMPTDDIFTGFQTLAWITEMRWGSIQAPIIETQETNAFFIGDPMTLVRTGQYHKVPMLIGYTDAEGIYFDQFMRNVTGQSLPVTDYFDFVPGDLNVQPGSEDALNLADELRLFYQGDRDPSDMQPFIDIYRDVWFAFPARRTALEHIKTNANNPIYLYRFTADTKMNVYKNRDPVTALYKGASHCDDLGHVFKTFITPDIQEGTIEDKAIDRTIEILSNFAKYSTPSITDQLDNWYPVQEDVVHYADIGSTGTVYGVNPDEENMNFWLVIYDRFYTNK